MTGRRAVAVSPHLDDASWSAGAVLAGLAHRAWDVEMVTVFTASVPDPSPFSVACRVDKGIDPDVDYLALRRAEDRTAAARLGAAATHLGLAEAPDRGYPSPAALFGPWLPGDAATVDELVGVLGPVLADADLVLGPIGLGDHVDHRIVVSALDRLDPPDQARWPDEPYRTLRGAAEPDPPPGWCRWVPPVDAASAAAHIDAALRYRSQLGLHLGGEARARRTLAAVVADLRLWSRGEGPWADPPA